MNALEPLSVQSARKIKAALALKKALPRQMRDGAFPVIRLVDAEHEVTIELPPDAVEMLVDILDRLAAKDAPVNKRIGTELNLGQAAEVLSISPARLKKILAEGKIPHRKVGKHTRIGVSDVISYKKTVERMEKAYGRENAWSMMNNKTNYGGASHSH